MAGISWDDIAVWYDELIRAGSGPHETAVESLRRLLPPLEGTTLIDVACGQGLATRTLVDAGAATVLGVDSSPDMVDLAAGHDATATYRLDDAQTLATCADQSFDGATCQLALMDIPDLDATLAAVHRVLRPGGWFVFVIGHPCVLLPPDGRGYFEERFWRSTNPEGVRRAGNHHRPLATYMNAVVRAGFGLEAIDEPRPSDRLAEQRPIYSEMPIFFASRWRRRW